jgi:F0F1-type ATP synthase assembly protein I
MTKQSPPKPPILLQYLGLATQMVAALLIAVYGGFWLDKKLALSVPVFAWLLPLLILIGMLIKVIRDTSNK